MVQFAKIRVFRTYLDELNREIYFGFSGAVNEDTAQSYGKDIGAQTVILGSIAKSGENVYRLRVQAIVVETKKIQAARTLNVTQDEVLLSLLNIKMQKEYRFTSSEKTSAGFKNMFFGLGSFKMGDGFGGGSTLLLEAVSLGCIVTGGILSKKRIYWPYGMTIKEFEEKIDKNKKVANTLIISGSSGLVLSWTWGFVRPFMYDKPAAVQKVANVIDHMNIMPFMTDDGLAVAVSLNYSF